MAYRTKDQGTSVIDVEGTETQRLKNQAALQLLQAWRIDDAQEQAETWMVIKEALEAGITDISFWGFTDKHAYTWVPGAKPLMFDENYKPKGAFYATHSALEDFVDEC